LMSSSEDTGVDPRFFTAPLPIVIHIVSSAIYIILGAFQFSPGLRRARLHWHRVAGRLLLPCGIVSALSAMWMAIYYAPLFGAGITIMYIRLVVSAAVILFLCLGFVAIRRREIQQHRAWMIRAYALIVAAGTQPLTLAISLTLLGSDELGYMSGLSAGWLINMIIAEWLIRRKAGKKYPVGDDLEIGILGDAEA
jgi:uncharacterized membrane protein